MSATNKTPNYNLPQWVGTDQLNWLVDMNNAMLKIDTGMSQNMMEANEAKQDAANAITAASTASTAANTAINAATEAKNAVDNIGTNTPVSVTPSSSIDSAPTAYQNQALNILSITGFCRCTTSISTNTKYFTLGIALPREVNFSSVAIWDSGSQEMSFTIMQNGDVIGTRALNSSGVSRILMPGALLI